MASRANGVEFPRSDKVQDALALLLQEHGGDCAALFTGDTYAPLADYFGLSDRARSVSRDELHGDGSSEPYWHTLVQFARQRLIEDRDMTRPRDGIWQLTDAGKVRADRVRREIGTSALRAFDKHTYRRLIPGLLKDPPEITLEELLAFDAQSGSPR